MFDRKTQSETAALHRRIAAATTARPGAAGTVRPAAHLLQEWLGNRGTRAFLDGRREKNRSVCDNKCAAGGTYGNTECEIDVKSGFLTGRVNKEVFDRNRCTRPCVELHENVHARKIAPICTATKKCTDAAKTWEQKYKCLDQLDAAMKAVEFTTECEAYTAEAPCLAERAKKPECTSGEGKKRFDAQTKMVKCYKTCFCKS